MRTSTFIASLVAGTALVALTACGGSAPPAASPSGGGGAPAAGSPAATTAAPTTAPAPAATTAPAASGGNFADLVRGSRNVSYKATYKMSGSSKGQAFNGEQTMYMKPPKMRMDITLPQGPGGSSMFMLENGNYMCAALAGTQNCLKLPGTQGLGTANQGAAAQDEMTTKPENFETTSAGNRTIAGQTGQCFNVKPKQAGSFDTALFCITSNGIPLLTQVKSSDTDITMEATNVSTTVADADFQLPAPVTEIPSGALPGGIPGGIPGQAPGGIPGGIPNIPGRP